MGIRTRIKAEGYQEGVPMDLDSLPEHEPGDNVPPVEDYEPTLSEQEAYLNSKPFDHDGHAECLMHMYGKYFHYTNAYGWLVWTGSHWDREEATSRLAKAIIKILRLRKAAIAKVEGREGLVGKCAASSAQVSGVQSIFQAYRTVDVSQFDANYDLLNVQNGVLDLATGQLTDHDFDLFTYCCPVDYLPETDFSKWLEWMAMTVTPKGAGFSSKYKSLVDYLQMAIGYSLTGQTRENIMFYIYGPPRSGKGTFIETIMAALGKPLAVETNFSTIVEKNKMDTNQAALATLKASRFVATSEGGKDQWFDPEQIKLISGENELHVALKYQAHFSYKPMFKIWLSSNHKPKMDPDDTAAWGRIKILKFPNSHLGKEDKLMKERMRSEDTLRQVLAWAVAGAMDWYAKGKDGLKDTPLVSSMTSDAQNEVDTIAHWLGDNTAADENGHVAYHLLYENYSNWCSATGNEARNQPNLLKALESKGYKRDYRPRVDGIIQPRGIRGMTLL